MNLSYEEACRGFIQCAEWAGVGQDGQQVVWISKQLRAAYPQHAPQLSALMINTYVSIVSQSGARITRDGYTLPGYTPPPPTPKVTSDADLLRILKPFYDEFMASHAG